MLSVEEVKQRLEVRLAHVNREIELTEQYANDPIKKQYNVGYMNGLNGMVGGQKQWLENLIKELS